MTIKPLLRDKALNKKDSCTAKKKKHYSLTLCGHVSGQARHRRNALPVRSRARPDMHSRVLLNMLLRSFC